MDISSRLTYFREKKGYTVNRLANNAGISQSFLREIELGNKKPTVETLSLLCDALNISLKEFFDDSTIDKLDGDELLQQLYRLTPQQRQLLCQFLKTLWKNKKTAKLILAVFLFAFVSRQLTLIFLNCDYITLCLYLLMFYCFLCRK